MISSYKYFDPAIISPKGKCDGRSLVKFTLCANLFRKCTGSSAVTLAISERLFLCAPLPSKVHVPVTKHTAFQPSLYCQLVCAHTGQLNSAAHVYRAPVGAVPAQVHYLQSCSHFPRPQNLFSYLIRLRSQEYYGVHLRWAGEFLPDRNALRN